QGRSSLTDVTHSRCCPERQSELQGSRKNKLSRALEGAVSEREPPEYCNKRMRPGSGTGAGNSCNPCRGAGGSLRSPPANLRGMANFPAGAERHRIMK